MRKTASLLSFALMSLAAVGTSAPVAFASHESSVFVISGFTVAENWIDFMGPCFEGVNDPLSYPANTLLFVSSGWGFVPWSEAPPEEIGPFMSEATSFTFLIDGELQTQSRHYQYFAAGEGFIPPDAMVKLFNTEYHKGLTGSHLFTGQLYLDAGLLGGSPGDPVLVIECNTVVNFTA